MGAGARAFAEGEDYQNTTDGEYGDGEQSSKKKKIRPPVFDILRGVLPYITASPEQSAARADLRVADTAARFDEATRRVALSFCVVNASKGPSPATKVSIRDRSTGELVGGSAIEPLSPGGKACRSDIWAAVPAGFSGARRYDLTVDPDDAVKESNESNNAGLATADVRQRTDLSVADSSAKFDAAARRVALAFCVVNRGGSASAKTEASVRDRRTGDVVATAPVQPLAPGGRECRGGLTVAVPAEFNGRRQYEVAVDPQNRISESDEDNNTSLVAVTINAQRPDLAFADAAVEFDQAAQRAALSFCVVNRSTAPSQQTRVSIRDRATGEVVANPRIEPIAAGARVCRKGLSAAVPAGFSGARRYDLVVDAEDRISESDETNNTAFVAAEVSAQPDLGFTDTAAKFDQIAREMVLSFCVINRGGAPSDETRVSIRDPSTGGEISSSRIAPLEPGRRTCRDGLLMPVAAGYVGARKYDLTVDPDGKVGESDESNNAASTEAYVSGQPNLGFADSSGRFDEAARRATLSFCVVNRGQASAGEAGVAIRDSVAGQSVGNPTIGALSAGGQACLDDVEVPVPQDHSGARHYDLAIDPQNAIQESDEQDNARTVSMLVPRAASPWEELLAPVKAILRPGAARTALLAIVGVAGLAICIFLVLIKTRRIKRARAPAPSESVEFRARPDPGTHVTHSASAQIVLPRLQLRGHVDPGRQRIDLRTAAE
jgi:subtilase family serine protease